MASDGGKAGDLTLSGGARRRRRRYAVGIWLTVAVFALVVVSLQWII